MSNQINEGAARYTAEKQNQSRPELSGTEGTQSPQQLVTDHLDLWTSTVSPKSTSGRGSNSKIELTGIKKLRELILELAVRGKLVTQSPEDEPASKLLEQIEAEKAQLIKDGKLKKQKPLAPVSEDEKPFELPEGWDWVRLGTLAAITGGFAFKSTNYHESGSARVIRISDFNENGLLTGTTVRHDYDSSLEQFVLENQNILMAMTGGTVGKACLVKEVNELMVVNQRVATIKLSAELPSEYLYGVLKTNHIQNVITEAKNSTNDNISMGDINGFYIPLPPLAEQQRIVAKVDELMALCDQLEQQSEHRLTAHQQLTDTLLATLTDSANAQELNDNWQRLANHFDLLFSGPMGAWAIDRLKDTILQLAVMGKLVPQNPEDEPASATLHGLALDREKWFKRNEDDTPECRTMQRKLAKLEFLGDATGIPNGWSKAHLIQVTKILVDCHNKTAPYVDNGIPIIRTTNIRNREFVDVDMRYVDHDTYDFWSRRCPPEPDDIIFTREAPMGEAAIIPKGKKYCLGQRTMLIRPMHDYIFNKYLLLALTEPHILERASEKAIGSTVKHLRVGDVENLVLPIPPLAEQHRIVAKVDELFALCDQLKDRLQQSSETEQHLTNAIVEQALN